jgi:hypothetical protein
MWVLGKLYILCHAMLTSHATGTIAVNSLVGAAAASTTPQTSANAQAGGVKRTADQADQGDNKRPKTEGPSNQDGGAAS